MWIINVIKRKLGYRKCLWCGRWVSRMIWRQLDCYCPDCKSAMDYGYTKRLREEIKEG